MTTKGPPCWKEHRPPSVSAQDLTSSALAQDVRRQPQPLVISDLPQETAVLDSLPENPPTRVSNQRPHVWIWVLLLKRKSGNPVYCSTPRHTSGQKTPQEPLHMIYRLDLSLL